MGDPQQIFKPCQNCSKIFWYSVMFVVIPGITVASNFAVIAAFSPHIYKMFPDDIPYFLELGAKIFFVVLAILGDCHLVCMVMLVYWLYFKKHQHTTSSANNATQRDILRINGQNIA